MMMQSQQKGGGLGGMSQNVDRSARSIFVGNISYDVNEEEIRKLLSACGQIIGFRLVHDRDTGRPKGFGFCEFADVQMAEAAIRNFNGYEVRGRPLRVDSATGNDRGGDEDQPFQMGGGGQMSRTQPQQPGGGGGPPPQSTPGGGPAPSMGGPMAGGPPPAAATIADENPYGPEPGQGKAPEVIARTVASMPPEKMFDLMRSMKETVNNNPQMARQLLIENPQLSYALLQAQVVMRVVDPKVAYSMLHREQAQPLAPPSSTIPPPHGQPSQQQQGPPPQQFQQGPPPVPFSMPPPLSAPQFGMPPPGGGGGQFMHHHNFPPPMGMPPMGMALPPQQQQQQRFAAAPPPLSGVSPVQMSSGSGQQQPMQQQQQAVPAAQQQNNDNLDEEQQAQMLVRVLQLTDEQIRMLPPTERAQVIELRNQLRNAGASA